MNAAHLHLLINHIPVTVTILSIVILIWAMFSNKREHYRIAFIGFVIAGVSILAVFESGENAEEIVEDLPGVTHDSIEEHEEAADITYWLMLILAAGGAGGLVMQKRQEKGFRLLVWGLLAFSLVAGGYLAYTANLGGHIRHTEISDTNSQDTGGNATVLGTERGD